ncbi:MAG: phosphoglucosamine mutase [Candidatus Bathyarchaeota archaeon]|nr:phosphoglucosamine mutase [Candidatus Bathyarchaeota archaeon]MCZ2845367.1 phosphoglucosamine mutase [Candidatus Bathyarchaeota archaeon]
MKKTNLQKRLFGTNGVRGVTNQELSPEFILKLSYSIGSFFNGGKIIIAYDGRLSSPMFFNAATSGLIGTGCEVNDAGMMPTPALQYLIREWQMDAGLMITASHNPPEYNGVKVVDKDGIEIPRSKEEKIEEIFFEEDYCLFEWDKLGKKIARFNGIDEYKEGIKSHVDYERIKLAKLKVVVDPGNGMGSLITPYLLRELGCEVYTINSNVDGNFPGRPPEPTLKNIQQLCKVVKACNASLGIALDGDADRAIFVDEVGIAHWGDKSFGIIEKNFLSNNPGEKIVTPVSSSKMIEEIADENDGKIVWTKVGSINVSRKMQEIKANLGGEENGGIFYRPHQPVRDGTMATALIVNLMSYKKQKFSELIKSLPCYYTIKDKIPCPEILKEKALEILVSKIKGQRIELIDGLKIWTSNESWVLIRPSGTEPIFRIFAEANDEKNALELAKKYKTIINQIVKEIK